MLALNFGSVTGNPGPANTSGEIKVLVDGSPVAAPDDLYDKTGTFQWWITAALYGYAGESGDAQAAALLAALKAHADTYTVTFSGINLKFGTNAATAIANAAAGTPVGTVTTQFTINASGVISVTASSKATHYFGVTEAQTTKGDEITLTGAITGGDIE